MNTITKCKRLAISLLVAIVISGLSACGGSDSSTSSSGGASAGSASISGNVSSGLALNSNSNALEKAIARLLDTVIAEAQANGISGVTVELYSGGMLVDTQTTDSSGEFTFNGLIPGNYNIKLMQAGQEVGNTPAIELSASTNTRLELNLSGTPIKVEVNAMNDSISGEVENSSEDDDSMDDPSSDDDDSSDDTDSEDDESSDDESADDNSDDDSADNS